jgi:hypothetical protein
MDYPIPLISIKEAARQLSLGTTKTRELMVCELDARKIGRRTVITTESVVRYIESLTSVGGRADRSAGGRHD